MLAGFDDGALLDCAVVSVRVDEGLTGDGWYVRQSVANKWAVKLKGQAVVFRHVPILVDDPSSLSTDIRFPIICGCCTIVREAVDTTGSGQLCFDLSYPGKIDLQVCKSRELN